MSGQERDARGARLEIVEVEKAPFSGLTNLAFCPRTKADREDLRRSAICLFDLAPHRR